MRALALLCVSFFSLTSFANQAQPVDEPQSVNQMTSGLALEDEFSPRNNVVEAGFQISSINSGSTFLTASVYREFAQWFSLGLRGMVPVEFDSEEQVYGVSLAPRFNILNNENIIYGEGQLTQGFFNDTFDTTPFVLMGVSAGYAHKFVNGLTIGVSYGIDYSQSRIRYGALYSNTDSLYNKLCMTGGYYF